MLRNHNFSGACPRPRPQLNKILRQRPSADAQKACVRDRTSLLCIAEPCLVVYSRFHFFALIKCAHAIFQISDRSQTLYKTVCITSWAECNFIQLYSSIIIVMNLNFITILCSITDPLRFTYYQFASCQLVITRNYFRRSAIGSAYLGPIALIDV